VASIGGRPSRSGSCAPRIDPVSGIASGGATGIDLASRLGGGPGIDSGGGGWFCIGGGGGGGGVGRTAARG